MEQVQVKKRDISIDILKFLAAIIITNSHMELLYGKYSALATGGAIGDALFFFCSGYTLFLGRDGGFFNWYKRRINRIYPTVFAWALVGILFFNQHVDLLDILVSGGGWFVSCIMIYYAIIWFIRRYASSHINIAFILSFLFILAWYFVIGIDDANGSNNIYGWCYFKWCHYFLFMLLGSVIGRNNKELRYKQPGSLKILFSLFLSVIAFYGLLWFKCRQGLIGDLLQISSLIPLAGICYSFYLLCNTYHVTRLINHNIVGPFIKITGGLCLEIYIVQNVMMTDCMNNIFPLNIIIMFALIVVAAYLLRCFSRAWSQTFKSEDYNLKEIVKLY